MLLLVDIITLHHDALLRMSLHYMIRTTILDLLYIQCFSPKTTYLLLLALSIFNREKKQEVRNRNRSEIFYSIDIDKNSMLFSAVHLLNIRNELGCNRYKTVVAEHIFIHNTGKKGKKGPS